MISLKEFLSTINEENAAGHSPKRVAKWLKVLKENVLQLSFYKNSVDTGY